MDHNVRQILAAISEELDMLLRSSTARGPEEMAFDFMADTADLTSVLDILRELNNNIDEEIKEGT